MVRVVAALAWFDESPEFLERCVGSLVGLVDEVVALDGAWRHFPDAAPRSSIAEHAAITRTAAAANIVPTVRSPKGIWESQVQKRAALMELASVNADWVFVIDADEYIASSDGDAARYELAYTDLLCAYVTFRNLNRGETMPGTTPLSGLNRRFFRAGTTVRIVHSGYMHGDRNLLVTEDAHDLSRLVELEHDNVNRGPDRNERSRQYRRARDSHGVEQWVTV